MRFQLTDVEYNIRIGYRINDIEIFARSALRRREDAKAHIIVKLRAAVLCCSVDTVYTVIVLHDRCGVRPAELWQLLPLRPRRQVCVQQPPRPPDLCMQLYICLLRNDKIRLERDALPAQRGHINTDILELKPYQTLYLLCIIAVAAAIPKQYRSLF